MLVAFAALIGVALLEPGKEEPRLAHLADVDESVLDRIELQNKELIVFEKIDEHWRLAAPFAAPANEIRVRQLLDAAHAESIAHYPLDPSDAAKFELDKPKAVLTLGKVKLAFGGSEPIDMRRYVQVGDTLHLVNDDFYHHLIAPAVDYVDKKLLPEDAAPREIMLPGLKASQGENAQWTLEPPGDSLGINDLINAWRTARAIEVKRIEAAPQGDIARIGLTGGQSIEFIIVQREPDLLLARPDWGLQYLLPGDSAKQLLALQKPEAEDKLEDEKADEEEDADAPHSPESQPDSDLGPLDEESEETPIPDSGED
jgi:hypothetical protein